MGEKHLSDLDALLQEHTLVLSDIAGLPHCCAHLNIVHVSGTRLETESLNTGGDRARRNEYHFPAGGTECAYPRNYATQGHIVGTTCLFGDGMRSDLHHDAAHILQYGTFSQKRIIAHFLLPNLGWLNSSTTL